MARVSLAYPKMANSARAPMERCVAFEKYDGSNLHWVWERELGWYAFGTRRDRFDLDEVGIAEFAHAHPELEQAPLMFQHELLESLTQILQRCEFFQSEELTVFTEFLGENSFAGRHVHADPKRLVLFDVETAHGFLSPWEFVEHFASLPIARVVYDGKLTGPFIENVRAGRFDVAEGVVCKGGETGQVWMAKIKTHAYEQRLKEAFNNRWEQFWE